MDNPLQSGRKNVGKMGPVKSENSEPMCFFLQNVLKTFEEPILALQKANLLLPDLITIMEQFRGGRFLADILHYDVHRRSLKTIFAISIKLCSLMLTDEVVDLAEQLCPENAQADDLFDEISILNKTLADITEKDFCSKTTEEKWRSIFEVEGATQTYKNLYRIVSAAISIPVSNAFIERIFSLVNIQWTKERNLLEVDTAPDVCWNKPFKERIRHYYSLWITNGDRQEYTAAGNPKAPALEVVLDWVDRSWQELSKEMIIKSFEVCGLATTSDGYGDDRINCFKPDGSIGTRGIDLLREFRGKETMKDGRNDVEEAGLSEDENNVELSGVGEDDELFFQI
uniref:HAT C-terminal dimerisation domain-containing protein n=1 Tax=Globodera rostochiensis TaxID=31243 RepID=A0A914H0G4_GLORO